MALTSSSNAHLGLTGALRLVVSSPPSPDYWRRGVVALWCAFELTRVVFAFTRSAYAEIDMQITDRRLPANLTTFCCF
ncbi:unnamed protein product [Heligmosomoides polygyrus]|uniref:Secreted protein n=1 Tax=Heligmosomoides polygyrus TaxID=6339 RepID=A0A183FPY6_HELPZ|nr:unnamed protein product [Heligmosomoides polygyrus]